MGNIKNLAEQILEEEKNSTEEQDQVADTRAEVLKDLENTQKNNELLNEKKFKEFFDGSISLEKNIQENLIDEVNEILSELSKGDGSDEDKTLDYIVKITKKFDDNNLNTKDINAGTNAAEELIASIDFSENNKKEEIKRQRK